MDKTSIEYKLAKLGIFGMAMNEVEDAIIFEAVEKNIAEILTIQDANKLRECIVRNEHENSYKGDVKLIKDDPEYYIRMKTPVWRSYMMKGNYKNSLMLFTLTSLVFTNSDGMSKERLKKESGVPSKSFTGCLTKLVDRHILYYKDGRYYYNEEEVVKKTDIETQKERQDIKEKEKSGVVKNKAEMLYPSTIINKELITEPFNFNTEAQKRVKMENECKKIIEDSTEVMRFEDLKTKLAISEEEIRDILDTIRNECRFNTYEDTFGAWHVIPAGVSTEERTNIILDIMNMLEIVLFSDWKVTFRSIYPELFAKKRNIIFNFFEKNNFVVLEIFSKSTPSEIVIYKPELSKESKNFIEVYKKGVSKIGHCFKEKIMRNFLRNPNFASFDNMYDPMIKNRVKVFYAYADEQIKKKDNAFVFDRESLLEMDMLSFSKCIQLCYINLFPEIIVSVFDGDGIEKNSAITAVKKYLKKDNYEYYDKIHDICVNQLEGVSLGMVLEKLDKKSKLYALLNSKASISEFIDCFKAVVKYNYFKMFENKEYIFFEFIDNLDVFMHDTQKESDKMQNEILVSIDFQTRKNLFLKIVEYSPDTFVTKTRELIKNEKINENVKKAFLKKLANF